MTVRDLIFGPGAVIRVDGRYLPFPQRLAWSLAIVADELLALPWEWPTR